MPQLALQAGITALILVVLLRRALAPILIPIDDNRLGAFTLVVVIAHLTGVRFLAFLTELSSHCWMMTVGNFRVCARLLTCEELRVSVVRRDRRIGLPTIRLTFRGASRRPNIVSEWPKLDSLDGDSSATMTP